MTTAIPVRVEILKGAPDGDHMLLDLPAEDIPSGLVYDKVVNIALGLSFLVVSNDSSGEQVPVEWLEGLDPAMTDRFIGVQSGTINAQPGDLLTGLVYNLSTGNVLLIELPETVTP